MSSTSGDEQRELRVLQAKVDRPRGMTDEDWARLHVLEKKYYPNRHAARMDSSRKKWSPGRPR